MRVPVWPTWSVWLRQPLLVTAREQPTTPPSSPASSSSAANPSADPTPATAADHDRRRGQRDAGHTLDAVAHDAARQHGVELRLEHGDVAASGWIARGAVGRVLGHGRQVHGRLAASPPRAAIRPSAPGSPAGRRRRERSWCSWRPSARRAGPPPGPAPRCPDRCRVPAPRNGSRPRDDLSDGLAPRLGSVVAEQVVVGLAHLVGAEGGQLVGEAVRLGPDGQRHEHRRRGATDRPTAIASRLAPARSPRSCSTTTRTTVTAAPPVRRAGRPPRVRRPGRGRGSWSR